MSYSRDDFMKAIADEVSSKPMAAQYFQAGDPRLLAQLGAMATMLGMVSQQLDVESMEPFNKVRDTTVLADASMKGILPFARPARLALAVTNGAGAPLSIGIGRRLLGPEGRVYVAETAAIIAAGDVGTINVKQMTTRTVQHIVSTSVPFYSVQVPVSSDADQQISGVLISVAGVSYPYTPEFSNVGNGDPAFTLETDEYRRLYVKFGWQDTFGIQPTNGTAVDMVIEETAGEATLPPTASFTFENSDSSADQSATIALSAVIFPGSNPIDIQTLRELAQYPSIYDGSAVYLGNFDLLVRRNLSSLRFLSVWNEQIEEAARGPSVTNINKLFVAALFDGASVDWLQAEITKVIQQADNSYRIRYVTPVEVPLPITINAQISIVHDPAEVKSQIRATMLGLYGRNASAAKRGMLQLNRKKIYDALKLNISALQDEGSDFEVLLGAMPSVKPEDYRFLSDTSMTVVVTIATYNDGLWSH